MLNLCSIVATILKMATGRNFSMSVINSGHHYLKMAAKTRHKKWAVKIQHCPISSKFDMWVDNDAFEPLKIATLSHVCNYKVQFCALKGDAQNLPFRRVGRVEISPLAVPRG
jgi:hypothetical protein